MRTEASHDHTLRPARAEDMAMCGRILNDWIDETPWMPRVHPREEVVRYHCDFVFKNQSVLVAESVSSEIEGFVATNDDQFITGFYLAPQARQNGLGTSMLSLVKHGNPSGVKLWTFVKNRGAQHFYEREGFQEVRRTDGDNEENLPDILYSWKPEGVAS